MQFVKNGPDIPERLLQEHESGRVVFFCGAGISYPAGLPGFGELVKKLLDAVGVEPTTVLNAALKSKKFDTAIGLLESDITGKRETVRSCLEKILTPELSLPDALATHEALLILSKSRDDKTRLITTNFDRLFDEVIIQKKLPLTSFHAPLLPIPKNKWDGLVYLHGFLKKAATAQDWDRLVLSSGDFGLAYLTERWAARFVSELFRNYTVCFVGYSIDDPVLRYMMDALDADRLLGESPPEMYAFGSCKKRNRTERENEWLAKNVTPILYLEDKAHKNLHKTLREWARTYRDGISAKENIVSQFALNKPISSTVQDDFVGRLIWALTEVNGLPAKKFSELNPVPSLDWLEAFSENRYANRELTKFGIEIKKGKWERTSFSLLKRPAPYWLSPLMTVADPMRSGAEMDLVMQHLARWLTRHLGDPHLLIWFANQGAQLNPQMRGLIQHRLREIKNAEEKNDPIEIARIISSSPNYFPDPVIRSLWSLMIVGRVFSKSHDGDLYQWLHNFQLEGLNTASRVELKAILSPHVLLRKAIPWREREQKNIRNHIDWEVVLASEHSHFAIREFSRTPEWSNILPNLIEDFTSLLIETMNLKAELGDADYWSDRSYFDQPSISDHSQNRDFQEWTVLVTLCKDSWLSVASNNAAKALLCAQSWMRQPYPIFKRLAFFAATQGTAVPTNEALEWLLSDDAWWLWSVETQREAMRLITHLGAKFDAEQTSKLEVHILNGPPRAMFNAQMKDESWIQIQDHSIWLRLNKLSKAGAKLSTNAISKMGDISNRNSGWKISDNEQEEFPHWLESGWYGDKDPWKTFEPTPVGHRSLLNYLLAKPVLKSSEQDDWPKRCKSNLRLTAFTLISLSDKNIWPKQRWQEALQVWAQEGLFLDSWNWVCVALENAPDEFLKEIIHEVCWWLEALAKTFENHEAKFLNLCNKIIDLNLEFKRSNELFADAINHPIGHVTEALLRWWYRKKPEDEHGLPVPLKVIFSKLCDPNLSKCIPGRVLLSTHVISLYRVDTTWTQSFLLPYFSWESHAEDATGAWEGFLWSPRLYPPLMQEIKKPFLDVVNHLEKLDKQVLQYSSLITYIALEPRGLFSNIELAKVTQSLPVKGLIECARSLCQLLEGAGDQRSEYWENRVEPYFRSIWPKLRQFTDQEKDQLSDILSRLCIEAKADFPRAFKMLHAWLRPVKHPFYILQQVLEARIAETHPLLTLDFLDILISENTSLMLTNLKDVLGVIENNAPEILSSKKFSRLLNQFRSNGQ